MSQIAFDFRSARRKKSFDFHRFLLLVKVYAFDTVSTVIVLLLLILFAITEVQPLVKSIWHALHAP